MPGFRGDGTRRYVEPDNAPGVLKLETAIARKPSMNRQNRKPRAIAIAKAEQAEAAALRTLAIICAGACVAIASLAFALIG